MDKAEAKDEHFPFRIKYRLKSIKALMKVRMLVGIQLHAFPLKLKLR